MSNKNQNEVESQNKVVLTPDDALAAYKFWTQFKIEPIPGLKEAFDKFAKEPSFENQQYLKYMVSLAISTTDHPCFKDAAFAPVAQECSKAAYELGFNYDFEEVVAEKGE